MIVGLDFETYGAVDLPKHGLDRYINDPSFRVLLACVFYEELGTTYKKTYDFVTDYTVAKHDLLKDLSTHTVDKIAAHNAGFERAVLKHLGFNTPLDFWIDTAVNARVNGAASKLEAAAPQLLAVDKLDEGGKLVKLFSCPGKYQEKYDTKDFVSDVVLEHPAEWGEFIRYCGLDAELSFQLAMRYPIPGKEQEYWAVTQAMNELGWYVDMVSVHKMQERYLENLRVAVDKFTARYGELNFNSLKQMKEFCHKRGVKAVSFDEKHVAKYLAAVNKKLDSPGVQGGKRVDYNEVWQMLLTKQMLGGSSLKKLQTIIDTVGADDRLRDQYLHCGASQTLRTTGRSVQMQNLKRLGSDQLVNLGEALQSSDYYSNDELAENMRQLFTSSHPEGVLIVGDFASVESRGLAWLAGEQWKLDAYRQGQDLYQVLADKFGNTRQFGKVGELSCGYGAGPGAVKDFAANMGMQLTEGEATQLVYSWRDANPGIVAFWKKLDEMLAYAMEYQNSGSFHDLADGFMLNIDTLPAPSSLRNQLGKPAHSLYVSVFDSINHLFLKRVFHGVSLHGNNIRYHRASDRKTGDLWRDGYIHPKTKQFKHYEIYGGKLAGILTQSFCRELFMQSLHATDVWVSKYDNVQLIGQFHDEIVLDWQPSQRGGTISLLAAKAALENTMSRPGLAKSFPLAAEVKHDYRYTK
jgi:DNA polymerase